MIKLLDLYCGAGGASKGYEQYFGDNIQITGVDNVWQNRYPYKFVLGNALEYMDKWGKGFDIIHASPPCQAHSALKYRWGKDYRDYISVTRDLLVDSGAKWVIENVVGAPLVNPIMLCGTMFGLRVLRHRLFESNVMLLQPVHVPHDKVGAIVGSKGHVAGNKNGYMTVTGHFIGVKAARKAMGIGWMTRDELAQAVPPAYTQYIAQFLGF